MVVKHTTEVQKPTLQVIREVEETEAEAEVETQMEIP